MGNDSIFEGNSAFGFCSCYFSLIFFSIFKFQVIIELILGNLNKIQ